MTKLNNFIELVHINLENVLLNLSDVVECATFEGAYCGPVVSLDEEGNNRYLALEFEQTTAPWDEYLNSKSLEELSEEELKVAILEHIQNLIELDNFDDFVEEKDKEDNDLFFFDMMLEDETFEEGLGI